MLQIAIDEAHALTLRGSPRADRPRAAVRVRRPHAPCRPRLPWRQPPPRSPRRASSRGARSLHPATELSVPRSSLKSEPRAPRSCQKNLLLANMKSPRSNNPLR
jgi:hypothetical protein